MFLRLLFPILAILLLVSIIAIPVLIIILLVKAIKNVFYSSHEKDGF